MFQSVYGVNYMWFPLVAILCFKMAVNKMKTLQTFNYKNHYVNQYYSFDISSEYNSQLHEDLINDHDDWSPCKHRIAGVGGMMVEAIYLIWVHLIMFFPGFLCYIISLV